MENLSFYLHTAIILSAATTITYFFITMCIAARAVRYEETYGKTCMDTDQKGLAAAGKVLSFLMLTLVLAAFRGFL